MDRVTAPSTVPAIGIEVAALPPRVARDVEQVVQFLRRRVPDLRAVILTGAFGRGEGALTPGPSPARQERGVFPPPLPKLRERRPGGEGAMLPANDYDFVLVSARPIERARLTRWGSELAAQLGVPGIDLLHIPLHALGWLPPTVLHFDLRYGSCLVWGDPAVLERLPLFAAADIPLVEAKALLFNRMVCLLEPMRAQYISRPPAGPESQALYVGASKAALAAMDAVLILRGRYTSRYRDRAALFAEEWSDHPDDVRLVQQALACKLDPQHEPNAEPLPYWHACREFLLRILDLIISWLYVWTAPLDDAAVFDRFYHGWEAHSATSLAELAEWHLLRALDPSGCVDEAALTLAEARLAELRAPLPGEQRAGAPRPSALLARWDEARAEAVRWWFQVCHA
jgi:hypothetical protein